MNYADTDKRYVGAMRSADDVKAALEPIKTSKRLIELGICLCDVCGERCSTDLRWCWKCEAEVMIVIRNRNYKPKIKTA